MEHPMQRSDEGGLRGSSMRADMDELDLMEEFLLASPGPDFPEFLHPGGASPSPFSPLFDLGSTITTAPAAGGGDDDGEDGGEESRRAWLIQPQEAPASVKERLGRALQGIASRSRGAAGELLVQVWVPTCIGDRQVLTTCGQPFWLDRRSDRLESYRTVSVKYQFSADETSCAELGLPGRVFVGRVPEWTPDVRLFTDNEYPRVRYAQHFDIRGSVAMPVFERRTGACLGVVELVMTTQKINYNAEIDNICNALKEVDLRGSDVSSDPRAQAKRASRHSDEKYKYCVSTVDEACYVRDAAMTGFHQACSEHHLFRGEGVVGTALGTNEPCFCPDITAYSKVQYPLSHYAKLFGLRAAVAIRLRSVKTGSMDLILEFFLPSNCINSEEQGSMLNSLSNTIQQASCTLRVVGVKELANDGSPESSSPTPPEVCDKPAEILDELHTSGINIPARTRSVDASEEVSSWIASLVDVQNSGAQGETDCGLPFGLRKQEDEGFSVTAGWPTSPVLVPEDKSFFPGFTKHEEYEVKGSPFSSDRSLSNSDKVIEKRRTKIEKTVSLQELRKHFAGSLKEAAKNLGVCPTTLKRICRHHGIDRWPSRKIKKVGHSLKKLQMVIDSVHGAEGTVRLSSLYENFTKTTWSERELQGDLSYPASEQKVQLEPSVPDRQCESRFSPHTSGSNSLSSTYSQSSNSSLGCSSEPKPQQQQSSAPQLAVKQEFFMEENQSSTQMKAASHDELRLFTEEKPVTLCRSQSHMLFSEHKPMANMSGMQEAKPDSLKIKAMYGEERCIFRLQPSWGFEKLKEEIAKRFGISQEVYDLKYLDDESEWVLLTCDADLLECIDVYKSSSAKTVRISVNPAVQPILRGSFG
ncbi:hypothetical protein CFC21_059204 [Triticum aestivum]|uniref:RWP-RK domain-containing protein n=2 Tax=Triticum aestivum TaxID=4565 RepID=A0A3B6IYS3_WHEAT|nr:hypothetical protein CFC21_059204 [Triticum aestivum]